jgi:hypothetical protein
MAGLDPAASCSLISPFERATGGSAAVREARRSGEKYLLERGLCRRNSTGEVVNPEYLDFAFPSYWHYAAGGFWAGGGGSRVLDRRCGVRPVGGTLADLVPARPSSLAGLRRAGSVGEHGLASADDVPRPALNGPAVVHRVPGP